ncbi:alpha/beta hydrolase [Glaciimonas sp. PAMC28666]|uniref:alpha/beta hydrolase n=1 Tax=Glaciimonas sp. PAMC28666 TaxID=2807626 RepID=UPI001964813A|nr:alpha/beta fold hydrolase [Glaciimonas sp. PAMC28666]QRX84540.1 alpha/beta hydrolase [Glaciimonas sp. PAMC28666]
MKHIKYKKVTGMGGIVALGWLIFTTAVAVTQRKLIFKPVRVKEVERPQSIGHRTRPVVLRSMDGTRLSGWLLIPRAPGPHPAVVYFGGRSEEVSWVARDAWRMFPNMTVLAINYRGYGDSEGIPGELKMIEDAHMLFDWMVEHQHVTAGKIAVVGRSLGSGVAVQLAVSRPVAAVVLITPYDSLLAIAKRRFPSIPGFVLRHRFDSVKHAPLLSAPTFIVRAASDDVVPGSHTDSLVAKLTSVLQDETIPDSDHSTIPYLESTQARIAGFLSTHFNKVNEVVASSVVVNVDASTNLITREPVPDHMISPIT